MGRTVADRTRLCCLRSHFQYYLYSGNDTEYPYNRRQRPSGLRQTAWRRPIVLNQWRRTRGELFLRPDVRPSRPTWGRPERDTVQPVEQTLDALRPLHVARVPAVAWLRLHPPSFECPLGSYSQPKPR